MPISQRFNQAISAEKQRLFPRDFLTDGRRMRPGTTSQPVSTSNTPPPASQRKAGDLLAAGLGGSQSSQTAEVAAPKTVDLQHRFTRRRLTSAKGLRR